MSAWELRAKFVRKLRHPPNKFKDWEEERSFTSFYVCVIHMRLIVVSSNNEFIFIVAYNFISCIYHVYSTFDENVIQVLTAVNNYAMDIHTYVYFLGNTYKVKFWICIC